MKFLSETSPFFADVTITSLSFIDMIGILGFCIYLINYSLVTFQKIDSRGVAFFMTNIVAAVCVLASLMQSFNLASALIQIFWICLGIIAITLRLLPKREKIIKTSAAINPFENKSPPAFARKSIKTYI